jgi:hypothetical protein
MASICTSNVTSGFIDLATFDELEKYMYGGPDATAYFVRETRKATWFTQVPVVLSRASGTPAFDTEWSVSISRAGDYLLATWLRLTTPKISLAYNPAFNNAPNAITSNNTVQAVRWTRNFMHSIIREACITFNDLVAARFDCYHLDFWSAFTVPASKRNAYNNMIGNFPEMTDPQIQAVGQNPTNPTSLTGIGSTLKPQTLNLPLPFFYARDSGVALPTAALPYNDMRLNFSFRRLDELLIVDTFTYDLNYANFVYQDSQPGSESLLAAGNNNTLTNVQVWANYAIVSNDERKRMACAPRDILIEQVQTAPRQSFTPTMCRFDIRFSHAIKVLFFSARNTTVSSSWSNYTTGQPVIDCSLPAATLLATGQPVCSIDYNSPSMVDPILNTSLIYENTNRLSVMGSDYFSLVNPWYSAPAIPLETGYHLYSYSLDFISLDPMGSTNYGKLTNVSIVPEPSQEAKEYSSATLAVLTPPILIASLTSPLSASAKNYAIGLLDPQSWMFIVTAVNNNIVRISGGALGFPVL